MQGWPVMGTQPLPPGCQAPDPRPGLQPFPVGAPDHLLQAGLVQYTEGTQRLEEPVSKMTVKFCGGEPMEMVPKYSICRQGGKGAGCGCWGGAGTQGELRGQGLRQHSRGLSDLGSGHWR